MAKKKVDYKRKYHEHFGIIEGEAVDEFEFVVNDRTVMSNKVHHILYGAHKFDDITNWMALTTENHDKCHNEELDRYYMKEIHLQFMNNNPY